MSVQARPFADPRNTYIVENNDPGAFDKSHRGKPGTHPEQRCCRDQSPQTLLWFLEQQPGAADGMSMTQQMRDFYGHEIGGDASRRYKYYGLPKLIDFGKVPGLQSLEWYRKNWAPGTFKHDPNITDNPADATAAFARYQDYVKGESVRRFLFRDPNELWCKPCKNLLEDFRDGMSSIDWSLMVTQFAGIVAYVPVLGTAVAFVMNTAVSIANGQDISDTLLNSVGGCLPGQPASKMAYDFARAAAQGQPIDKMLIAALPVSEQVKDYIGTSVEIFRGIADGRAISDIGLEQLAKRLPPQSREAFDIAVRVLNGENIGDIALQEAAARAKAAGQGAVNNFKAQVGFQGLLDSIPPDIAHAIQMGMAMGEGQRLQGKGEYPVKSLGRAESAAVRAINDPLASKGRAIIMSGAKTWRTRANPTPILLSDIRNNRTSWTFTRASDNQTITQNVINDDWRRGFDIAIGLCDKQTSHSHGQEKVRSTLANISKTNGFDSGQQIQHDISKGVIAMSGESQYASASNIESLASLRAAVEPAAKVLGRTYNVTVEDRLTIKNAAAEGAAMATRNPQIAAARGLNSDGSYRWGFDVGSAIAKGLTDHNIAQNRIRTLLKAPHPGVGPNGGIGSVQCAVGFDAAQALQHGMTKAYLSSKIEELSNLDPSTAAGMMIANGLAGSKASEEAKVNALTSTLNDPNAKAGAGAVVNAKVGFFSRIWRFFFRG